MDAQWPVSLTARARLHAALAEPARLAIVDGLLLGDASPTELSRALGIPSNLLAHHLALLEQAELITRARSEADQRRMYVRLNPGALADRTPDTARIAPRVVFVCTSNAARSQLAAALWRRRSTLPAASAGTAPAARVHPRAIAVAGRHGLDLARARTRSLDQVLSSDDLLIAVCDNAYEHLDSRLTDRLHWAVPDPVAVGTVAAFEAVLADLSDRVDRLAPLVRTAEPPSADGTRPDPDIGGR